MDRNVELKVWNLINGMIIGTEDVPALGQSLDHSIAMTAATECYGGTSGRGNPRIASMIRGIAALGYVKVQKQGRTERVSHTAKGLQFYQNSPYSAQD